MRNRFGGVRLGVLALLAIPAGLAVGIVGLELRRERALTPARGDATVTGSSHLEAAVPTVASRLSDQGGPNLDFAARIAALGIESDAWPELAGSIVRADDGAPVPFAEVAVEPFLGMTVAPGFARVREAGDITGRADEHGSFRLRTSVDVLVVVRAPGLAPEAAVVERSNSGDADLLHFELQRSLLLEGRIVDASGEPVVAADVRAVGIRKAGDYRFWGGFCGNPRIEWQTHFGRTDADGRFDSVECYVGGRALFEIIDGADLYFLPSIAIDATPSGRRSLELRLPRHALIAGSVRRADGSPVGDVMLRIERRFECMSPIDFAAMTNEEGAYLRTLTRPGTYRITLETQTDDGATLELARRDVQLAAGVNALDFEVEAPAPRLCEMAGEEELSADDEPAPGSVSGRVMVGAPIDGAAACSVHLLRDGAEAARAVVDDAGDFEFESVAPGTYTAVALCAGRSRFDTGPFVVASGCRVALPVWTLAPASSIRGRVFDANGRPVADARVGLEVVLPRAGARRPSETAVASIDSTTTDPSGRFTLAHVGAPARIYVECEGALTTVRAIAAHTTSEELRIEVAATRRARGRIEVAGGLPTTTFKVSCNVDVPGALRAELGDEIGETSQLCDARVAADGTFELETFPTTACDLELWVNTSGWKTMGCVVARRHVDAGSADLDLGAWVLSTDSE